MASGHKRSACDMGMADFTPNARASYEAEQTMPRPSAVPPTRRYGARPAPSGSAHRAQLDLPARRLAARRASALAEFSAEHGASGLRALGGRRAAERWLVEQPADTDRPALVAALAARIAGS